MKTHPDPEAELQALEAEGIGWLGLALLFLCFALAWIFSRGCGRQTAADQTLNSQHTKPSTPKTNARPT